MPTGGVDEEDEEMYRSNHRHSENRSKEWNVSSRGGMIEDRSRNEVQTFRRNLNHNERRVVWSQDPSLINSLYHSRSRDSRSDHQSCETSGGARMSEEACVHANQGMAVHNPYESAQGRGRTWLSTHDNNINQEIPENYYEKLQGSRDSLTTEYDISKEYQRSESRYQKLRPSACEIHENYGIPMGVGNRFESSGKRDAGSYKNNDKLVDDYYNKAREGNHDQRHDQAHVRKHEQSSERRERGNGHRDGQGNLNNDHQVRKKGDYRESQMKREDYKPREYYQKGLGSQEKQSPESCNKTNVQERKDDIRHMDKEKEINQSTGHINRYKNLCEEITSRSSNAPVSASRSSTVQVTTSRSTSMQVPTSMSSSSSKQVSTSSSSHVQVPISRSSSMQVAASRSCSITQVSTPRSRNAPISLNFTFTSSNAPIPTSTNSSVQVPTSKRSIMQVSTSSSNAQVPRPTSKSNIAQVPASRSNIEQVPTSMSDIAQVPTFKSIIVQVPTSRSNIAQVPTTKSNAVQAPTSKSNIVQVPASKSNIRLIPTSRGIILQVPTSKSNIAQVPTSKSNIAQVPTSKSDFAQVPTTKSNNVQVPASKSNIEVIPTSRSNIAQVPASKRNIAQVPASRSDIAQVPASKSNTVQVPTPKSNIAQVPASKSNIELIPTSRSNIVQVPVSKSNIAQVPTSKSNIAQLSTSKSNIELIPTSKSNIPQVHTSRSNIEQVPTSKSNIVQEPISKSNIEQVPMSMSNIAQVPTPKSIIVQVPTSKSNIAQVPTSKSDIAQVPTTKSNAVQAPTSKSNIAQVPASKSNIEQIPTSRSNSAQVPASKHNKYAEVPTSRSDIAQVPSSKNNTAQVPTSRSNIAQVPASTSSNERVRHPFTAHPLIDLGSQHGDDHLQRQRNRESLLNRGDENLMRNGKKSKASHIHTDGKTRTETAALLPPSLHYPSSRREDVVIKSVDPRDRISDCTTRQGVDEQHELKNWNKIREQKMSDNCDGHQVETVGSISGEILQCQARHCESDDAGKFPAQLTIEKSQVTTKKTDMKTKSNEKVQQKNKMNEKEDRSADVIKESHCDGDHRAIHEVTCVKKLPATTYDRQPSSTHNNTNERDKKNNKKCLDKERKMDEPKPKHQSRSHRSGRKNESITKHMSNEEHTRRSGQDKTTCANGNESSLEKQGSDTGEKHVKRDVCFVNVQESTSSSRNVHVCSSENSNAQVSSCRIERKRHKANHVSINVNSQHGEFHVRGQRTIRGELSREDNSVVKRGEEIEESPIKANLPKVQAKGKGLLSPSMATESDVDNPVSDRSLVQVEDKQHAMDKMEDQGMSHISSESYQKRVNIKEDEKKRKSIPSITIETNTMKIIRKTTSSKGVVLEKNINKEKYSRVEFIKDSQSDFRKSSLVKQKSKNKECQLNKKDKSVVARREESEGLLIHQDMPNEHRSKMSPSPDLLHALPSTGDDVELATVDEDSRISDISVVQTRQAVDEQLTADDSKKVRGMRTYRIITKSKKISAETESSMKLKLKRKSGNEVEPSWEVIKETQPILCKPYINGGGQSSSEQYHRTKPGDMNISSVPDRVRDFIMIVCSYNMFAFSMVYYEYPLFE